MVDSVVVGAAEVVGLRKRGLKDVDGPTMSSISTRGAASGCYELPCELVVSILLLTASTADLRADLWIQFGRLQSHVAVMNEVKHS